MQTVYTRRQEQLAQACEKNPYKLNSQIDKSIKGRNLLYSKQRNLVYCMIEKVGCTFWRRIFYFDEHMDKHQQYKSIYDLPHYKMHERGAIPTLGPYSENQSRNILQNSFKALFVRNPYERAYSAYVDKLVSPNVYYWNQDGRPAVRMVRANASKNSRNCGHDVTFPEFVKYLLKLNEKKQYIDIHFTPMYTHCQPCEIKYDFIGRMETFSEDSTFLMNKTGLLGNSTMNLTSSANAKDNMRLVFEDTLSNLKKYSKCMTPKETIERAWYVMKLRGIIRPQAEVPVYTNQNVDDLVEIGMKFNDPDKVSSYKRENSIKAYRSLDKSLLEDFRKFLHIDFQLFGYEDRPSSIFE